jgi:hypothetical protein
VGGGRRIAALLGEPRIAGRRWEGRDSVLGRVIGSSSLLEAKRKLSRKSASDRSGKPAAPEGSEALERRARSPSGISAGDAP